ncbi:hypothetical protein ACFLYA_03055, partial [Candidatus Dependentiae bacterium]
MLCVILLCASMPIASKVAFEDVEKSGLLNVVLARIKCAANAAYAGIIGIASSVDHDVAPELVSIESKLDDATIPTLGTIDSKIDFIGGDSACCLTVESKVDIVTTKLNVIVVTIDTPCCQTVISKLDDEVIPELISIESKLDDKVIPLLEPVKEIENIILNGSPACQTIQSRLDNQVIPESISIESKLDQWIGPSIDDMNNKLDIILQGCVNEADVATAVSGLDELNLELGSIESKLDLWIGPLNETIDSKVDNIESSVDSLSTISCEPIVEQINILTKGDIIAPGANTITSDGIYTLTSNITGCVVIDADKVSIDLNTFKICCDSPNAVIEILPGH